MFFQYKNRIHFQYYKLPTRYILFNSSNFLIPPRSSCTGGAGGVGGITGAATGALDTATVGKDLPWREKRVDFYETATIFNGK